MKIAAFILTLIFLTPSFIVVGQSESDRITTSDNKSFYGIITEFIPEKGILKLKEQNGVTRQIPLEMIKRIHTDQSVIQNQNGELNNPESKESKFLILSVEKNNQKIAEVLFLSELSGAQKAKTDSISTLNSIENPLLWQQTELMKLMYYEMAKKDPATAVGIGLFIPGGAQFYAGNTMGGLNYGFLRLTSGILAIRAFNKKLGDTGWFWTALYAGSTFMEFYQAGSEIMDANKKILQDINNSTLLPDTFGMNLQPDVSVGFSVTF